MKLGLKLVFFLSLQLLSAQIQDKVDFIRAEVNIEPIPVEKRIKGTVRYEFNVLKDIDSIFLDAKNMEFAKVLLDSKKVRFVNHGDRIIIKKKLKKGKKYFLYLDYSTFPKQTVYFTGWQFPDSLVSNKHIENGNSGYAQVKKAIDNRLLYAINRKEGQIWTQGQGKYTSHWLPSLDDMTEKVEFDLSITFDNGYEVFANGTLMKKKEYYGKNLWKFNMKQPMSSYLLAFVIGDFKKKAIKSKSGIPIELYYEPKDSLKVEPTYRYSKHIFDFLEKEIGVPYPWQNYKQIPVQDFLYAGMENTGATIFSNTFMVDSIAFVDKNYVNVNAHEMAHQWFGNLVTEQSGEHHWLHEGFATYYAYLAEKDIFGDDYFYWHLLETATSLNNFSGEGNGESLTDPSAGSLTFYEKGAWALVMLKERVGDLNFKEGIKNYLDKYAFQNVTISDFMWEMEKASGMKLMDFEELWLQESEFPFEIALTFLKEKSNSIKMFLLAKEMNAEAYEKGEQDWFTWFSNDSGPKEFKREYIFDFIEHIPDSTLQKIARNESLQVRQAVALAVKEIPKELQDTFESMLLDKSYVTQENILFKLWESFPTEREKYLDLTRDIEGLPNKNVRLLWLTLALVTPEYAEDQKPNYFDELSGYTGAEHHFEVRLLAFQYLKGIGALNDQAVKNLIDACNHHVWHFKKSSRKMLKEFLKQSENKERLKGIYPTLSLEQQQYVDKTLGK